MFNLFILRKIAKFTLAAFLALFLAESAQAYSPSEVIGSVNQERLIYGVNTLIPDNRLSQAANQKAAYMLEKEYFDHFSPQGVTPWDFILSSGFDYQYAGENLALNYTDSLEVTQAWMDSQTHRDNILNDRFNRVGVGVASGELKGQPATITVLMLGKEMTPMEILFNQPLSFLIKDLLGVK